MFGDVVRGHRGRLGLTQEEFADFIGLSARRLREIERGRGRPRPSTVQLLANALRLTGPDREAFCQAALAPAAVGAARAWVRPRPAQLPADVPGFTGRADQLDRLTAVLDDGAAPPARAVVSAITGTAGIGKTTLATHWAHTVADRFPDGQLYVNLHGFGPTAAVTAPAEALRGFLDALGVTPQAVPTELSAQAALYRSLLADKRVLVILDNARDPEQVRPLLPGYPGCLTLITSRDQLTGLLAADGAHPVTLDLLSPAEAHQLLSHRLGSDRVAGEPEAVGEIIARCSGLPLALSIMTARAAQCPAMPLTALAAELRGRRERLAALDSGDPATELQAVLSWSYERLSAAGARLFRLLGLHPGPDLATAAAASLAGLPVHRARRLLAELARTHLIAEHAPGRYTFHDLLGAYAAEQARVHDTDDDRQAAIHRLLDHYLHTAHTADQLLDPSRPDPITLLAPQPGVTPERPGDHDAAMAWFVTERPALLAAVRHAAATGFDAHTRQLARTLTEFLDRQGDWHGQVAVQQAAVAAARRLADPPAQAHAHHFLATAYIRHGRFDEAATHLRHALDQARHAGDQAGQADIHNRLAEVWTRQGRHADALQHALQALDLVRTGHHRVGLARALNGVGWSYTHLGQHQLGLTYCRQALTLCQELGDRRAEAATWDSLGYAHHHLGHHHRAITCYHRSIELYREAGDRYYTAETLVHLGEAHRIAGNLEGARVTWYHALTILEDLDHASAVHVRTRLHHLDQAASPAARPTRSRS